MAFDIAFISAFADQQESQLEEKGIDIWQSTEMSLSNSNLLHPSQDLLANCIGSCRLQQLATPLKVLGLGNCWLQQLAALLKILFGLLKLRAQMPQCEGMAWNCWCWKYLDFYRKRLNHTLQSTKWEDSRDRNRGRWETLWVCRAQVCCLRACRAQVCNLIGHGGWSTQSTEIKIGWCWLGTVGCSNRVIDLFINTRLTHYTSHWLLWLESIVLLICERVFGSSASKSIRLDGSQLSYCPKRKAEGDLLASNGGRKA